MKRYSGGARFYDVLSGERPVYRAGRLRGIAALDLRSGAQVLDVGCGTGLNIEPIIDRVGANGAVQGVDRSTAMLAQARARVSKQGWSNVDLRAGDASELSTILGARSGFDAAIFTYSLSIIDDWQACFDQTLAALRPGGRIAVVDMALPTGRWRILRPLARLACFTGGADPHRAPWNRLLNSTEQSTHEIITGGHVHIAAGTRSGANR
ncbi:MAG: methyltransferase domain-containing protein [Antricoccus sp.]